MTLDPSVGFLGVDYETSSAWDIKNGAWAYSEHESTIVYVACFAYAESRDGPRKRWRWYPGDDLPRQIVRYLEDGGRLVAHNAAFEKSVTTNVLTPVYRWPKIAGEQWVDTQALALAINLPLALEGVAKVLGCPVQKDKEGAALMRAMATPTWCEKTGGWIYDRDPAHLERLSEYCADDVDATLDALFRMPDLSETEAAIYRVDQRANERGMYIDRDFAARSLRMAEARKAELADETFELTGGELTNSTNSHAIKAFLKSHGVPLPKVTKKNAAGEMRTVETADKNAINAILEGEALDPVVRGVLLNRVEANKATSLAKLKRVDSMVGHDGRLRFALGYQGAHTGRWTSSGLQVHNLPKPPKNADEAWMIRHAIESGRLDALKFVADRPLEAISGALRSMICAPPGRELIAADYSAIEARVVAWLANQADVLQLFAEGRDVYVKAAADVGSSNRQLGKVCVLALGYGMGVLKFATTAAGYGIHLDLKEAARIQKLWRGSNDKIVSLWYELGAAAHAAVEDPGRIYRVGHLRLLCKRDCLYMQLPSGRAIRYWRPQIVRVEKKFQTVNELGEVETATRTMDELQFYTMGPDKRTMTRESTYGGKLVENATQAIARDLLGVALPRIDDVDPYDIVVHVHDSIVAEVPTGAGDVAEFCALMAELPPWAGGLPLAAEGYRALRFAG